MELTDVIQSQKGIRFRCAACGHCCSGESEGHVFVYKGEIQAICSQLKISEDKFLCTYCDVVDAAYKDGYVPTIVLKMNPTTQNCIFQQTNDTCKIYPVRPSQCKSFPFWALNLRNIDAWEKVKETCPGFSAKKGGHIYKLDEINAFLDEERRLEDEHYNILKQNQFNLSALYPCLVKKATTLDVTKSLDQQHSGTIPRRPRDGAAGDSPDARGN